jgi:hypothetical protein
MGLKHSDIYIYIYIYIYILTTRLSVVEAYEVLNYENITAYSCSVLIRFLFTVHLTTPTAAQSTVFHLMPMNQ